MDVEQVTRQQVFPGSAEPRREMGGGQHFSNTSKCYTATLFMSHLSVPLCSLHRLLTPDSQSRYLAVLLLYWFGFNSLKVYAIFHEVGRKDSLSVKTKNNQTVDHCFLYDCQMLLMTSLSEYRRQ